MNTQALQSLTNRWPNDIAPNDGLQSLQILGAQLTGPKNQSAYRDAIQLNAADSQSIAAFANANGLTYSQYTTYAIPSDGPTPAWVGVLHSSLTPVLAHEVKGMILGREASCLIAYTVDGWQQKREDEVSLTKRSVIRVSLAKTFPQLFLDSNKNDKGTVSTVPVSFKTNQKLTLEGSFNDYFDFYSPHNLQINALTVLAPNYMQLLIDNAATFDVEFFGGEVFFITNEPIYTPENFQFALQALEAQLTYVDRLMASWNYKPLHAPFDLLESTTVTGPVTKVGPFRISPAQLILAILVGLALLGIVAAVLNTGVKT